MLTVKLLVLELGALLLYAGITGRSVGSLLRGDNTKQVANTSLTGPNPAQVALAGGQQNPAQAALAGGQGSPPARGTSSQAIRQTSGRPQASPVAPAAYGTIGF